MRPLSALFALTLLACGPDPSSVTPGASSSDPAPAGPSGSAAPSSTGSATGGSGTKVEAPELRDAVRIDPVSFEATLLGRVRVGGAPPYRVELVEGGDALRAIVAEMNALDHVMSAGVGMPPQRVEPNSPDFPRIREHGWLKVRHHVELRLPIVAPRSPRRFDVWSAQPDRATLLGQVDVDAMDYLWIVGGPPEQRATLGKIVAARNAQTGASVQVPPPDGEIGKWGRLIARGTPLHFAMMRDELLVAGALLVPQGRPKPAEHTIEGPLDRYGKRRWLSAHVPGGFTAVTPQAREHLHLQGPPGGPSSFRALSYSGVTYDAASLRAYVKQNHGSAPGFAEGEAGEIEIAGRKLLAMAFRTGEGPATAAHAVALWPELLHLYEGDEHRDRGIALELSIGAGRGETKLADFAAHPSIGPVIDSLYVDLDAMR